MTDMSEYCQCGHLKRFHPDYTGTGETPCTMRGCECKGFTPIQPDVKKLEWAIGELRSLSTWGNYQVEFIHGDKDRYGQHTALPRGQYGIFHAGTPMTVPIDLYTAIWLMLNEWTDGYRKSVLKAIGLLRRCLAEYSGGSQ